jgi:hypothetical protein
MPREYAADDGDAITKRIKELRKARADADNCLCVKSDDGKTVSNMGNCPVHKYAYFAESGAYC